ncbi:ABC-type sugar transport system, substrate-binding protein, contains N-terminal xre family HTH domain [Sporobacter termitidis DSM 10068]|uniref:ABC-type sugar transport system, substrate-binding protein, contains N-terminal xre family HTH domain n=1 Tax=Sporobacter termitidis DSM 10068 TaxID=1123282 RepID=A0A1M5XLX4_9FIRM|nr:substrate-binding domain-containing protein [Sporobacter termitidis]SHI00253.1 ABC-type sugar transport system, substrate-binding protein, contains N-terminal xre family HTH domain [Sporobacter termitidis DSM 10068]
MKKVIAVFLALLMTVSLFACATKDTGSSPSGSAAPSPSDTAGASASPSAEYPDLSKNADVLGLFSDGVDPASRKTYNIVYMYPFTLLLFQKMEECFNIYSSQLNYNKLTTSTTEGDMDKFVENIQTFADQGKADGFIVVVDADTSVRIKEVLDETNIPYVGFCNSVRDKTTGSEVMPAVGNDSKLASAKTVQWLYDNYKTYWGDIDPTQIALLDTNASSNSDLKDRFTAAEAKFNELLPKNAGVFELDMISDFSQDTAFNMASATFSAHPEVKYWFSANCVEMYAQGVARAAETMGIDKRVLITDVGSDILTSEWDTSYDGPWKSCLAISNYLYAAPCISALIALMDGKATPESLWPDMRTPGDQYTFYNAETTMVTKDTYKEYFNKYAQLAGAPLPYPD